MTSDHAMTWSCRGVDVPLGRNTLVMGVLNCTPDSFSDGGNYLEVEKAVERGEEMIREGATLLDVGGESTRPGAEAVPAEVEAQRVVPVIKALSDQTSALLSVDTSKAAVAEAALEAGAHVVNDVTAGTGDPSMADLVADSGCGMVLMHMQGSPRTMQHEPTYQDVVQDIHEYLLKRCESMVEAGCRHEQLCIDPGIGFGKTVQHNLQLLKNLRRFRSLGRPLMVGASRKSFLGKLTGRDVDDRLAASLAVVTYLVLNGADIVRVHDVKESCDATRLADMVKGDESTPIHP